MADYGMESLALRIECGRGAKNARAAADAVMAAEPGRDLFCGRRARADQQDGLDFRQMSTIRPRAA